MKLLLVLLFLVSLLARQPSRTSGLIAQTSAPDCTSANADDSYTVASNWSLNPSTLTDGSKFRILSVTSTTGNAESTDIARPTTPRCRPVPKPTVLSATAGAVRQPPLLEQRFPSSYSTSNQICQTTSINHINHSNHAHHSSDNLLH